MLRVVCYRSSFDYWREIGDVPVKFNNCEIFQDGTGTRSVLCAPLARPRWPARVSSRTERASFVRTAQRPKSSEGERVRRMHRLLQVCSHLTGLTHLLPVQVPRRNPQVSFVLVCSETNPWRTNQYLNGIAKGLVRLSQELSRTNKNFRPRFRLRLRLGTWTGH